MQNRKAVFLDKDGTLIPNIPYNVDPEQITLMPGAAAALVRLQTHGYIFVVISNQAGVARGLFQEEDLQPVRRKIESLFQSEGLKLAGFYYCPHHPEGSVAKYCQPCSCRKPAEGMILQAARELSIDLERSWMMGDILNDVEAGKRAGCRSILLNHGNETEWVDGPFRKPDFVASDMVQAADFIINTTIYGKHNNQDLSVAY
jgi:D-glycero-D-manno-heptose 1,7-bisphosphate phosphatase